MAGKIIFLLEEPSMKVLLDNLLPRLFPGWRAGEHFLCVKHDGKKDLDRSIPIKLKAWREPGVRFVILRDNDNADCMDIKAKLHQMCVAAGRPETLIRMVCQELESWYLGDLQALEKAFGCTVNTPKNQKRFAVPDKRHKPSEDIRQIIPHFQNTSGARAVAEHLGLQLQANRSHSFRVFLAGIQGLRYPK
jgi:hypothetical protein